jgi:4-hydroxy-3-methylbut-2-enyl diphosphate reductase
MEIKLAKTAGFCMGVRRAVDIVLDLAQHEKMRRIYTYGPLIHNPQTIALLKSRGVRPIEKIEEIQDRQNAVLVIRAHGIAPAERKKIKESGIRVVDATCPKVGYVQAIIKKHAAMDFTVVIVGDKEHPEVEGLLGFTDGKGMIISSVEEAEKISGKDRICVVAQTTQDADSYHRIVHQIKSCCPQAIVFNTICSSTEQRQAEVSAMAGEMDAMFIVGGKNSANTKRLADLAKKKQPHTYHIEDPADMENVDISRFNKVGVSAGASTPNWIIDRVMDKIMEGQSRKLKGFGALLKIWIQLVKTDLYSAIGAACLCVACLKMMNLPLAWPFIAIASLYVFGIHILNRLISRKPAGMVGSFRESSYQKHGKIYWTAAVVAVGVALALAWLSSLSVFVFLFIISFAGVIYNMNILPNVFRFRSLRDLPSSKNISISLAWAMAAALLPYLGSGRPAISGLIVAFCFTFGVVFIRSAMADILEMQSDKLIGQETIPVVFGRQKTISILNVITLILLMLLFIAYPAGWTSSLSLFLLPCLLYQWICFEICDKKAALSGAVKEGLLETSYLVAGFCVFFWSFF